MKKLIYLLVLIFVSTACKMPDETIPEHAQLDTFYPAVVEVTEDDFTYRLFTEKDVYDEYGETAIFAELTYVGDKDSIKISHNASPFYFSLKERTRNFNVDYPMDDPLIITTLKKDEPLREKYTFSGGYSDTDAPKYIEFIQTIINNGFPKGNYVIERSAQFSTTNSIDEAEKDKFEMNGKIEFSFIGISNN